MKRSVMWVLGLALGVSVSSHAYATGVLECFKNIDDVQMAKNTLP